MRENHKNNTDTNKEDTWPSVSEVEIRTGNNSSLLKLCILFIVTILFIYLLLFIYYLLLFIICYSYFLFFIFII